MRSLRMLYVCVVGKHLLRRRLDKGEQLTWTKLPLLQTRGMPSSLTTAVIFPVCIMNSSIEEKPMRGLLSPLKKIHGATFVHCLTC